jgi:hypothetical protein
MVPLMLRQIPRHTLRATTSSPAVSAETRVRPPGSDWAYMKLYGPRTFQDDLITGPLHDLAQFATGTGLADSWFSCALQTRSHI